MKKAKKKNHGLVPRLSFKDKSINFYLMVTLMIFTFVLGMLTTKIFFLAKYGGNTKITKNAHVKAIPANPSPAGPLDIGSGNNSVQGNESAKVTVVEFADFRCPFCKQWYTETGKNLMKDYIDTGKVKFAYRNYAFLGEASTLAANASACANEQSMFWNFHDYLFDQQPDEPDTSMYTVENLAQIAGTLGMDPEQFTGCLSEKKYAKDVAKDLSDGQSVGVQGTPTIFVNGVAVVGAVPYAELKKEIDKALEANK